jgi:hypothetical protein
MDDATLTRSSLLGFGGALAGPTIAVESGLAARSEEQYPRNLTQLEAVAEAAAQRRRWIFSLTINPLRVPCATGGPVNPIAVS